MVQQFTLLLGIILIGYLYLSRSNYRRSKLTGRSNYEILYESILAGLVLFGVEWGVLAFVKVQFGLCSQSEVLSFQACSVWISSPIPHFETLLASVVYLVTLNRCLNWFVTEQSVLEERARNSSLISSMVLDALSKR